MISGSYTTFLVAICGKKKTHPQKLKLSRLNTRGRNALACALLHVGVDECEGIGTHSDSTKTCQHTQCSSHTPPESTYRENAHVQLRQQLLGEKTKW